VARNLTEQGAADAQRLGKILGRFNSRSMRSGTVASPARFKRPNISPHRFAVAIAWFSVPVWLRTIASNRWPRTFKGRRRT
jgi:hypothetical protein